MIAAAIDKPPGYVRPEPPADPVLRSQAEALQLFLGTEPPRRAKILTPIAALDEVRAVSLSVTEGRGVPRLHDLRSLAADVDVALSRLGAELKAYLGAAGDDYRKQEIPRLVEFLGTAAGASRTLHATRYLRQRLEDGRAAQAAWRDLVRTVRAGCPEAEARHASLVLIEIAESLGHEWRWVRSRVSHPLTEGRFDEVEQRIGEPPETSARVAWFAFAEAHVPHGFLRLGQVQFFSYEIWPDLVRDETALIKQYPDAEYPAELDDRMTHYMSGTKDGASAAEQRAAAEAEHRVFARVELAGPRAADEMNPWAQGRPPDRWARDLVLGLVEAAAFRWGGSQWKLLDGTCVYHGEITFGDETAPNWSGNLGFSDPEIRERNRRLRPPHLEPTGTSLGELDPAFAARAAAGDPAAEDAIGQVRWYQVAKDQRDRAQRIALFVRTFERLLPIAGSERWYETVARYFRDFWARGTFDLDVQDALLETETWLNWSGVKLDQLSELGGWLAPHSSGGQSLNLKTFLSVVDQIEPLIRRDQPDGRRHRRRLRELGRLAASREDTRVRHEQLATEFDILLARAVRQRNAVIHGIRTIDAVVATVEPFIAQLAAWLINESLEHAAAGTDLLDGLEHHRAHARERLHHLNRGTESVPDLIYFG